MSALDLSPSPGPAPAARRVWRHARTEARLLVRNGEQLLLALVIPVGILVLGPMLGGRWLRLAELAPSVLALAVWSTAFTSQAISTGFERRYGLLERLAATPLGRSGLVAGKALATTLVLLGQLAILVLVAVLLGWRPAGNPLGWLVAGPTVLLAAVAFAAWGLALAGRLRAEITLALANLIYLAGAALGGILVPADRLGPLGEALALLPTAALADALRAASAGAAHPLALVLVAAWAAAGVLLARKVFRWTG